MSPIFAGFVMLLPALTAFIVLIGVPIAVGAWLFPYLREHLPGRHPAASRLLHARDRRSGHDRRHHHVRARGTSGHHPTPA